MYNSNIHCILNDFMNFNKYIILENKNVVSERQRVHEKKELQKNALALKKIIIFGSCKVDKQNTAKIKFYRKLYRVS